MSLNERYISYLQQAFDISEEESRKRVEIMHQPIGKSIQLNPRKVDIPDFIQQHEKAGWHFTPTNIPEVFYIDRDDTTTALGATDEHKRGEFYIQEVAASHPPHILRQTIENSSNNRLKTKNYKLILDMCSSPGGKTNQLAGYFPESLIIANEADKGRLPQLYENIDRMGHTNICVTNYDGRYYKNFSETFDAIMLDAPCSGEGCAFKTKEALKHWHIKNIRRIAKLQYQLFLTAYEALKPGGMLVYSTCTLNKEENEGVIEKALKKINVPNPENSKLIPHNSSRLWPHETYTGGFFYATFQKASDATSSQPMDTQTIPAKNNIQPAGKDTDGNYLYSFKKDTYTCSHDVSDLMETMYFTKIGIPKKKVASRKQETTRKDEVVLSIPDPAG